MKLFKRISIALLAACVIGGTALTASGCGGENPSPDPEPTYSRIDSVSSSVPDDDDDDYNYGGTLTLPEYVAQYKSTNDYSLAEYTANQVNGSITTQAEGNNFTMIFQFRGEAWGAGSLRERLKLMDSDYYELIDDMKVRTNVSNPQVVVRYLDKHGDEIIEYTYRGDRTSIETTGGSNYSTGDTGSTDSSYENDTFGMQFASLQDYVNACKIGTINHSNDLAYEFFENPEYLFLERKPTLNYYAENDTTLVYEFTSSMVTWPEFEVEEMIRDDLQNTSSAYNHFDTIEDSVENQITNTNINVKVIYNFGYTTVEKTFY